LFTTRYAGGQGYGLSEGMITVELLCTDRSKAIATIYADGSDPEVVALTGDAAPEYAPGTVFKDVRDPVQNTLGGVVFLVGTRLGNDSTRNRTGLYAVTGGVGGTMDRIERVGGAAPGTSATFDHFRTAAINSSDWVVFLAKLSGTGVTTSNDTGVWVWDTTGIEYVAREGSEAADTDGATWSRFRSLALPEGGRPLFEANLRRVGGVTPATDVGLWVVNSSEQVQLVVREGVTEIGGRTVGKFKVIGRVSESPGQARSHNGTGQVVYWAKFTDRTEGIITVEIP
jgi:hypothetical protein